MECFSHPSSQAVGICKSCGKAVCRACAKDLGFAIACSDSCAAELAAEHEIFCVQRGELYRRLHDLSSRKRDRYSMLTIVKAA
jgi:hypothetical protein